MVAIASKQQAGQGKDQPFDGFWATKYNGIVTDMNRSESSNLIDPALSSDHDKVKENTMKRFLRIFMTLTILTGLISGCTSKLGVAYLVLVNKENKLPDDWEEKLQTVKILNSLGDEVEVEKQAYEACLKLKAALEKDGIFVDLDSARRSVAAQQQIWDTFMERYDEEYTRTYVAPPKDNQ